jgi:hypothetical protein
MNRMFFLAGYLVGPILLAVLTYRMANRLLDSSDSAYRRGVIPR